MPRPRPFLLSFLACPCLLLGQAVVQPAAPSTSLDSSAPIPETGRGDAAAIQLLDDALACLTPDKVQWLQMTVWQRVHCDDFGFQAEGRFLAAPGRRRRLRLDVRVGRTRANVQVISDGQRLCHRTQVCQETPAVTHLDLPAEPDGAAEGLLQRHGVGGVTALLQALRDHLQQPRREAALWGGSKVIRLTGAWPVSAARLASLPEDQPASSVPRSCRVFLDPQTLWLRRAEWWGMGPGGTGALLSQVEFRDPVINHPLTMRQAAAEFSLEPPGPSALPGQRSAR